MSSNNSSQSAADFTERNLTSNVLTREQAITTLGGYYTFMINAFINPPEGVGILEGSTFDYNRFNEKFRSRCEGHTVETLNTLLSEFLNNKIVVSAGHASVPNTRYSRTFVESRGASELSGSPAVNWKYLFTPRKASFYDRDESLEEILRDERSSRKRKGRA